MMKAGSFDIHTDYEFGSSFKKELHFPLEVHKLLYLQATVFTGIKSLHYVGTLGIGFDQDLISIKQLPVYVNSMSCFRQTFPVHRTLHSNELMTLVWRDEHLHSKISELEGTESLSDKDKNYVLKISYVYEPLSA